MNRPRQLGWGKNVGHSPTRRRRRAEAADILGQPAGFIPEGTGASLQREATDYLSLDVITQLNSGANPGATRSSHSRMEPITNFSCPPNSP